MRISSNYGSSINLDEYLYVGEEKIPENILNSLPTNLQEVNHLKAMSSYRNDPNLSLEENIKRKEFFAKMEESIRNKKTYGKTAKQKRDIKKKKSIANKSRRRNIK